MRSGPSPGPSEALWATRRAEGTMDAEGEA